MKFLKLFFRRNFVNNKLTYLNIAGLTIGMFTFLFIFFYVYTERNYDQFLPNAKEIYHLEFSINKNGIHSLYSSTPIPLANTIYHECPGIENWCTFCSIFETRVLNNGESDFLNPEMLYANPGFLTTFHYKAIEGTLDHALEPGKVIITRSAARKYLGTDHAVGKKIKLLHDQKEPLNLTVEAVIEDIPYNSNVRFEIVGNMDDYLRLVGKWVDSWFIKASQSYITLKKGSDVASVKKEIEALVNKYANANANNTEALGIASVSMENISRKHFKKEYILQHPSETFVNENSLKVLFLVGLIALVISWLNYVNFLIFQNTKYFKEVGIRKIIGSNKSKLIFSMVKELMLLTAIPLIATLLLFVWISPALYAIFHFQMSRIQINSSQFWTLVVSLFFVGSLLSAIYPIWKLTSYKPLEMIRKRAVPTKMNNRGSLVLTTQFVLSILLISAIIGINRQMKYLEVQKLGFTKENILVMAPPITADVSSYEQEMELFKEETLHIPGVVALSAASSVPGKKLITEHFGLKNREETINKYLGLSCDEDYFNVIDVPFLAGENFSKNPAINKNQIIINECLAHKLGFNSPVEAIHQLTNRDQKEIIGVVADYHHTSLHENVKPTLFLCELNRLAYFMIKSKSEFNQSQIELLRNKWNAIFTNSPFEYSFLETEFNQQYLEEKQLSYVMLLFSALSILITMLGLIGSCLNNTYMRTKEIGVRKINGAKVWEIMVLLNNAFVKWVVIAFVIATPIAYYAMNKWLENFAYKTELSWWIFVLAGLLALGIALLTVSWQSWRAATRNPVEALRYE
jgi:putative ABC transport system permease protein